MQVCSACYKINRMDNVGDTVSNVLKSAIYSAQKTALVFYFLTHTELYLPDRPAAVIIHNTHSIFWNQHFKL